MRLVGEPECEVGGPGELSVSLVGEPECEAKCRLLP